MKLAKSKFYNPNEARGYTIYVTLEPILLHTIISNEVKSYLSDVKCGFNTNKSIAIDSLVCANINNLTIEQFFNEGIGCTNIGAKISGNLIRVATQRIYSDPYRSFIEPVVNSIDAYNEIHGNPSTTGKFGMCYS